MPRPASSTLPNESHLSREDIELLAKIAGGQEALIAQINTLHLSQNTQAEAQRQQADSQRKDHNEQMKTLKTQIESLELWRVTTITPTRVLNWDVAAERVGDYLNDKAVERQEKINQRVEKWAYLLGIASVILGLVSFIFYWLLDNVILPLITRKGV